MIPSPEILDDNLKRARDTLSGSGIDEEGDDNKKQKLLASDQINGKENDDGSRQLENIGDDVNGISQVNSKNSNLTSFYKQHQIELNELQEKLFYKKSHLDTLKDEVLGLKETYSETQKRWESLRDDRNQKSQEVTLKTNELKKIEEQYKQKEKFMSKQHELQMEKMNVEGRADIQKLAAKYSSEIDQLKFEKIKQYEEQKDKLLKDLDKIRDDTEAKKLEVNGLLQSIEQSFLVKKDEWTKQFDEKLQNDKQIKEETRDSIVQLRKKLEETLKPQLIEKVDHLQVLRAQLNEVVNLNKSKFDEKDALKIGINEKTVLFDDFASKKQELELYIQNTQKELFQINEISIKEESMRRELHNELQDLRGNIRVFCRVRSTLKNLEDPDTSHIIVDPFNDSKGSQCIKIQKELRSTQKFQFDKVFDQKDSNNTVFNEIGQLVQSSLDGYNVCIFAYGQTGSGKTYTMLNPGDGIVPSTIKHIFDWTENLKEKGWKYNISCQFLEIYNETLVDLLRDESSIDNDNTGTFSGKKHEIRHDMENNSTTITNVNTPILKSKDCVDKLMKRATKLRATASTLANERSSRSHSIFIIYLNGMNSVTGETSNGVLNLVDLAGSERISTSQVTGQRLKETQNINRSLSCLGDVIHALGLKDAATRHVPFRNSKLTYLLQNSLTGTSKTLMFVNVSPSKSHMNETLNSLRFASKVNSTKMVARST